MDMDRVREIEHEIQLRAELVRQFMARIQRGTGTIWEARKAVKEDNIVRRLERELTAIYQAEERKVNS